MLSFLSRSPNIHIVLWTVERGDSDHRRLVSRRRRKCDLRHFNHRGTGYDSSKFLCTELTSFEILIVHDSNSIIHEETTWTGAVNQDRRWWSSKIYSRAASLIHKYSICVCVVSRITNDMWWISISYPGSIQLSDKITIHVKRPLESFDNIRMHDALCKKFFFTATILLPTPIFEYP